jgi:hypothetical protein
LKTYRYRSECDYIENSSDYRWIKHILVLDK